MKQKSAIYLIVAALLFSLPVPVYASETDNGTNYLTEDTETSEGSIEDTITEGEKGGEDIISEETLPFNTEHLVEEPLEPEDQSQDKMAEEFVPAELQEESIQEELIQETDANFLFDDTVLEDEPLVSEGGVTGFVSRMYTVVLNRQPDKAGLDDWVNRLQTGSADGAAVAQGFITSKEFTKRNLSDSKYLDVLYRTFFDRDADAEGQKTWMGKLDAGMSREYVLRGFVNSQEFQELCDSFGIKRGTMELGNKRDQNEGITMFVNRLYVKALGRKGEPGGMEDWTGRILDHILSPEDVAKSFIFSDEFTNKKLNNTEYVKVLYRTFMDREYDQAGLDDWVEKMAGGMNREKVLEGFSRSKEFANLLSQYGLSLGPISVLDFGAVPNDAGDDTDAFNKAFEQEGVDSIYVPAGTYVIDAKKGIMPKSNKSLVMDSEAILDVVGNSSGTYNVINIRNVQNVSISGGQIRGERDKHTGSSGESGMGIGIYDGVNITISGVSISGNWGDGIYLGTMDDKDDIYGCDNIKIENCKIFNNRRSNISIVDADNVTIDRCTISDAKGTAPQCGINIEPNRDSSGRIPEDAICKHIRITNTTINVLGKNDYYGQYFCFMTAYYPNDKSMHTADDMIIDNCTLNGDCGNYSGTNVTISNTVIRGTFYDYQGTKLNNVSYEGIWRG